MVLRPEGPQLSPCGSCARYPGVVVDDPVLVSPGTVDSVGGGLMPDEGPIGEPVCPASGLHSCRVAAALTQAEVASAVGTNQMRVKELEDYVRFVPRGMFRDLCDALEVYPEDLAHASGVQVAPFSNEPAGRRGHAVDQKRAERHRQVERIKAQATYGKRPGTVVLLGLEAWRHASGLTQRELARRANMSPATIVQLEKGLPREKWRRVPGAYMRTVKRLCAALGVSPADLICGPSDTDVR